MARSSAKKKRRLKVEDVQEEEGEKSFLSFPEACILVTTAALICGIAVILIKYNAVFGL